VDGADTATGSIEKTSGWEDYRTVTLTGTISLPAGIHHIRVKPTTMPNGAVMNLRAITLTPSG